MTTEKFAERAGDIDLVPEERVRQRLRGTVRDVAAIDRTDRDRALLLSSGQQQMWVLHQLDPTSPAYLMSWALRITGPLDAEAMRWAWETIVHRHEILRSRYSQTGDEPLQLIDPPERFALRVVDLDDEPATTREERAVQAVAQEARRPFDLVTEQPLRVTLVRINATTHLLAIVMHHIACDGASYLRIATELNALYAERVTGQPARLPNVAVQYADYAAWERARASDDTLKPHVDYWRRRLDGLTDMGLPTDRPRPDRPDWRGGAVEVPISPKLSEGVANLASALRASPYIVLLAVYQAMLAQVSGNADVAVGTPVSMRDRPELDNLVGYAINTVVIRSMYDGDLPFTDFVAHVRERFLEALDHRAVPFKQLVDELRPARATATNPLFQVAFDMNPSDTGVFHLPGLEVRHLRPARWDLAKFDLTLHVEVAATGQLSAWLEYASALLDEKTARGYASHYAHLLAAVVGSPDELLGGVRASFATPRTLAGPTGNGTAPLAADVPATAGTDENGALVAALHQAWRDVLRIDEVDPNDNFFDIGGDSLRAVALAGRLKTIGFELTAADIFAHQTVGDLARVVAGRQRISPQSTGTAPFAQISREDRGALPAGVVDAYPVGTAQLGMIVEMRARPDMSRYQDTTSFRVRTGEALSPTALQAAVQLAVDRHEVLRTTFDLSNYSTMLQLVHRQAAIVVGVTDHGELGPDGWEPKLRTYSAQQRRIPMDLTRAPLLRVHAHVASGTTDWWISVTECHPILEGWSFHSLLMEMLVSYQDIRAGRTPATPEPVSFRYADHIAAEAAALRSEDDRAYWRDVIGGRMPATLPSGWQGDRNAPEQRYQHTVPFHDLEDGLRALAAKTNTSLKAVLLTAHLKVMASIVEGENFFTGLVCDARPEIVGADRVPGMYLNTLPFPMPVGAQTWGELVRQVFDGLTTMWPHRRFPMQIIQQEFAPGTRLIEVMFNYLDFHQVDKELVDWEGAIDETDNEFAVHVFTISGLLRLNTTTYALSRAAARRFGAMYRAVLADMSGQPDGDATSVLLAEGEADRLDEYGTGPELTDVPTTVLESFAEWARDRPDAVVARHGSQTMTVAELDAAADSLAERLRSAGVPPGGLVAVAPPRDLSTPAVLLGVWKTGAAWFPLDGADVLDHWDTVARDAGAAALVVPIRGAGHDNGEPVRGTVDVIALCHRRAVVPADSATGEVLPDAAACILPSSRTTGRGVVVSHRSLMHALERLRTRLTESTEATAPARVWLYSSPLDTSMSLIELFLPITTRAQVVISAEALPAGTTELADTLATGEVTHLQVTSPIAEQMRLPEPGPTVIVGGRAPKDAIHPGKSATRWIEVGGADGVPGWLTSAGEPLPGLSLRVLDAALRTVPIGGRGELCVAGAALADGYHGDPVRTAEHFVPDPGGRDGARLFRTGQLARFGEDGRLDLLGPADLQTTSLGPVDLSHVRDVLCRQSSVRDAYVLLRERPDSGRLVAYVRALPDAPFDPVQVRRSVADQLSRQLVPDILVEVEAWPLTRHGEIDWEALPEPGDASDVSKNDHQQWDEQFEALLRAALPFLADDDELTPGLELNAAGLDSLSIVELLVSLEHAYDIVIPDSQMVFDMFETAASLWAEISELRAVEHGAPAGRP